jgi:hypothetical protein
LETGLRPTNVRIPKSQPRTSPDASAEDVVAVATAPARDVAGRYFANGRPARAAAFARDAARCEDLWDWAAGLAGLTVHESLA